MSLVVGGGVGRPVAGEAAAQVLHAAAVAFVSPANAASGVMIQLHRRVFSFERRELPGLAARLEVLVPRPLLEPAPVAGA